MLNNKVMTLVRCRRILCAMAADASSLHCPNCGAACRARRAAVPLLRGAARDGQLSVLLCADIRRRGVLPPLRRAPGAHAETRRRQPRSCPGCTEAACSCCRWARRRCSSARRATGSGSTPTSFESLCAEREAQAAVMHRFAQSAVRPPAACATGRAPRCAQDDEPRQLRPALGNHRRRLQAATARSWTPASCTGSWRSSGRAASSAPARVSSRSSRSRSGKFATRRPRRRARPRQGGAASERRAAGTAWTFMIGDDS